MMKKFTKCFSVLLCVLLLCLTFASCLEKEPTPKEEFVYKLEDFEYYTNKFKKEINVGEIKDSDDAIAKADKLFVETYGEENMERKKPYQAFFDEENESWYVRGTLQQPLFGGRRVGGVPHVIFDFDGNVLALWHDK
ncbi:MAG: hypothetical protein IKT42_01560 [Clostridia bacterium]|nr:hypothetical protein [Clostridia bacterium]